jgi:hypothetical protein
LGTSAIYDVCYGNSVFVCVAADGKIAYSSDGDTWTAATSSGTVLGTSALSGVCWSGTKFVAVGASGKIAYSTDGDTWTAASSSETVLGSNTIYAVAFGGTKFVCVGDSGGPGYLAPIAYSSDGDTWTEATDSEMVSPDGASFSARGIAYGNSVFVIVSSSGKIIYSSDGDIWTIAQSLSYLDDLAFTAVTYTDGYFIAVGDESSAGDAGNILISEDGKTWMKIEGDYNTGAGDCWAIGGNDNGTFVVGSETGSLVYGEISSTNLQLRKPPDNTESGLKYIIKYQ